MNKTKILICNDLDGTIFKTEDFIEHIIKSLSKEESDLLRLRIYETRKTKGSSVGLSVMNIIGNELKNVKKINRENYIYEDVKKYIESTLHSNLEIKHIILTHGEDSWQKIKIKNSILENLPIEIRSTNDKIEFIKSLLSKQNKYNYKEYLADYCILVDDKALSFEDGKGSLDTAKSLPNFKGFKITRDNEHKHKYNLVVTDFINQVSSLNQVQDYIKNMSMD